MSKGIDAIGTSPKERIQGRRLFHITYHWRVYRIATSVHQLLELFDGYKAWQIHGAGSDCWPVFKHSTDVVHRFHNGQ